MLSIVVEQMKSFVQQGITAQDSYEGSKAVETILRWLEVASVSAAPSALVSMNVRTLEALHMVDICSNSWRSQIEY